jgi:uncharacterized NAD(P)/FAD-binding protein YdhS
MSQPQPVVIVGAGYSGTLLAVNLLRYGGHVVLVEREGAALARGLAYATREMDHLLNVRAANMSAFPDDSSHFLRWLGYSAPDVADRFIPRQTYGDYLTDLLAKVKADAPDRLTLVEGEAVAVDGAGTSLSLADGRILQGQAIVLALGHFTPMALPQLAALSEPWLVTNPWQGELAQGLPAKGKVLLIGTGLTAVDVAITLDKAGFEGSITALSRRGLPPRAHMATGPAVTPVKRHEARGSWLLRHIRQRSADIGWRQAVDELRPHSQHVWRQHDLAARSRFLRHARPWWDVHRHRIAPAVAQRIEQMQDAGRLRFTGGKLLGADVIEGMAQVTWRPCGSQQSETDRFDRVILCTGPESDLTRSAHPLLASLLGSGNARPDPLHLGLDVDHVGHLRDAMGQRQRHLFAIGPITKGEAWEIVAVPDIRRQVWDLARYLTHTHWVGGEGL